MELFVAVSAVVIYLLVEQQGVSFDKIPLLTGLGYLAGAVAGGPQGALWAPALVVTGWGLGNDAQSWDSIASISLPESAAHLSDVEALRHLVPDVAERDVFVCGSPQWMDHVVAAAEQAGVPREHLHVERFSY